MRRLVKYIVKKSKVKAKCNIFILKIFVRTYLLFTKSNLTIVRRYIEKKLVDIDNRLQEEK